MAKKSNAKRSKSGTKTPTREPTSEVVSRSTSPEASVEGDDGDKYEGSPNVVGQSEDPQDADRPGIQPVEISSASIEAEEAQAITEEEVTKTLTAEDAERENPEQGGLVSEEAAEEQLESIAGEAPADSERTQDEASPIPQVEELNPADNEESPENTEAPVTDHPAPVSSQPDTEEPTEGNIDSEDSPVVVNGHADDEVDQHDEPEAEPEVEDDEDETEDERIQNLEAELAQTVREKEHLSTQYRTLLGKLQAMRNSLGEKLKEDAVSRSQKEIKIGAHTDSAAHSTLSGRTRSSRSSNQPIDHRPPNHPNNALDRSNRTHLPFTRKRFS